MRAYERLLRYVKVHTTSDPDNEIYGADTVNLRIKDNYRNMIEKIRPHFHLVELPRKLSVW